MPKARNAKADEALALYRQGHKLVDIAKQLDLPEGTVRRWKCTYKWDGDKANARKGKEPTLATKEAPQRVTGTQPDMERLKAIRTPDAGGCSASISHRRPWISWA